MAKRQRGWVDRHRSTEGINTVVCQSMRGKSIQLPGGAEVTVGEVHVDRTGQITLRDVTGAHLCSFKRKKALVTRFGNSNRVFIKGGYTIFLPIPAP